MKARSREPADPRYLYEQIYAELKEEILSGKYLKGDWFPPERVLKDRFATTHLTVRNALAKLVLEGYIERYSGKGTVVIYAREGASVQKKALRFPWAHVILQDLDEANAALLQRLEAQLRKIPLPVRISCHGGDVLLEQGLRRDAERSGALVILEPALVAEPDGDEGPSSTTVIIGTSEAKGGGSRVLVDDEEGARRAVRLLADRGHRRLALLLSSARHPGLQRGFLAELAARGLPADPTQVVTCPPGADGGTEAAGRLLAAGTEWRAFLCSSDETAAGALAAVRDAGLAPGTRASVIGYGNTRLARALRLTSVDPGFDRVADRVLAMALSAMGEGALPAQAASVIPEIQPRST